MLISYTINVFLHGFSEKLKQFSCTDLLCGWNRQYKETLKNYLPVPLENHTCFSNAPIPEKESLRSLSRKAKNQSSGIISIDKINFINFQIQSY